MYKLKDEAKLHIEFLWTMDGNDSLKRILRRGLPPAENIEATGPSIELKDTRIYPTDYFLSRTYVDKWEKEPRPGIVPCETEQVSNFWEV
jgi:hypothetical protein